MWKLPNGKVIGRGRDVVIDGVTHPAIIFRQWSRDELAAIGIKEWVDASFDNRYYKSTGWTEDEVDNVITRTHTITNKYTKAKLKQIFGRRIKDIIFKKFVAAKAMVDFYEDFDNTDPDLVLWQTYRSDLKTAWQTIKSEGSALTTYVEIVEYVSSTWLTRLPDEPSNGID